MTWHVDAACNGMDPETFFPERGDVQAVRTAKAVCAGCPVILECRTENIMEKDGIFGGLSGKQRREYRRVHGVGRSCLQCGTTFRAYTDQQILCSTECKKARHAERKAESALRAWWSE